MLPEFIVVMLTLFNEGSVCDDHELRSIARVIQVRAQERKLTIKQVCLERSQFSCWNGFKAKRKILKAYRAGKYRTTPAWQRARSAAMALYKGELDHLPRWNHYYRTNTVSAPVWGKELKKVHLERFHTFGRIEK